MREVEPNQGRRVRSADAAVIKAVEHEAALEREAELRERQAAAQMQRSQRGPERNPQQASSQMTQHPSQPARLTRQAPSQPARLTRQAPQGAPSGTQPVSQIAPSQAQRNPQAAPQRQAAVQLQRDQRNLLQVPVHKPQQNAPQREPHYIASNFDVSAAQFDEPEKQPELVFGEGAEEQETKPSRAARREVKRENREHKSEAVLASASAPKRVGRKTEKSSGEEVSEYEDFEEELEEKPKKTRKSVKEARAYGVKRKRHFTLPLLIILLIVILFAIAAVYCLTVYNEDTDLIVSEHTIEAGSTANLDMYITGQPRYPKYVSCNLDFTTVNYTLPQTIRFTVRMYGTNFPCVLEIVDTTPPTAEAIPQKMFSVDELPAVEDCVTNIYDLNDVTVEWLELPDITQGGNLIAKAAVTDTSGNCCIVDVPFLVTKDSIAPTIEGTHDIEMYIGDPISYREEVVVTDDIDPNPVLEIDTSEVVADEPGTYTVTYRAKDFSGNTSETTITLKLKKKPSTYVEPEDVYAEAQKILDKITNSDMSDMEKAIQITYWVRYNVYYVSNCDDSSWTRAAYDGFTKRSGNCYTFAMCAKALFDVAGIENMIIIRDPYIYNPHYWNYIKIDDQWYHCDSTPRIGWSSYFFMYTTKELKNFWHNGWNGYNFPEDKYPPSATESVQSKINYSGHSIKN